jgi:beta-glucosidase
LTATFPKCGVRYLFITAKEYGRPYLTRKGNLKIQIYIDERNEPLFAFGFGLSYTTLIIQI